jgi:hypothetical protein
VPVAAYVAGLPFGLLGVTLAASLSGLLITMPLQFHIVGRTGFITRSELWRDFLRFLPLWVSVTSCVYLACFLLPHSFSPLIQILCGTLVGLLAALITIGLIPIQRETAQKVLHHAAKAWANLIRTRRQA